MKSAAAGFTLVELLVAMTLLAFLSVLLFGGLRFGSRAWESAQSGFAEESAIRNAEETLTTTIAHAYPLPLASDDGHTRIDFEGGAHELTWISAARTPSGGMSRLHLFGDDALKLSTRDELAGASAARTRPLVSGVEGIDIAYFGRRAGETVAHWAGDWHGQSYLPELIRVRLALRDPRHAWPELVVAPRIAADANCVLDALMHDCRGGR